MSRLPMVDEPAPPEVQAVYDDFKAAAKAPQTPYFMKILGGHVHVLKAFSGLAKHVMIAGELPAVLKEMICVVVSSCNGSMPCIDAHTEALANLGAGPDVIQALMSNLDAADLPRVTKRILRFSHKVATDGNAVTDRDFDDLRRDGLTDREILEVVAVVCMNQLFNTFSKSVLVAPGERL